MAVLALLLGGIGWGSLLLLRRITLKSRRCGWRSTACCISRVTISQLAAFSLSFMLLALLLVLRGDLLERWQQQLPPDSPNYFLLNMTEAQVPQVKTFLQQHPDQAGNLLSDRPGAPDRDKPAAGDRAGA